MQTKSKLIILISIITLSGLVSQPAIELWTQKITIENRLRDKFTIAIGRIIPETEFIVNVEAELTEEVIKENQSEDSNLERLSALEPGSGQNSGKAATPNNNSNNNDGFCFDCAGCILDFNYMGPIPCEGKHLEAPCANAKRIECPQSTKAKTNYTQKTTSFNNEVSTEPNKLQKVTTSSFLNKLDVKIYLSENSMDPTTVSEVFEIVCDLMPKAKKCDSDCSDCIQIKQYEFADTRNTDDGKTEQLLQRIKDLENAASEQQQQIRDERDKASKNRLERLEEELYSLQLERETTRDQDQIKNDQRLRDLELKEEFARKQAEEDLKELKRREEDRITLAMRRYDDMLERVLLGAQNQGSNIKAKVERQEENNPQKRTKQERMQYPKGKNDNAMWFIIIIIIMIGFSLLFILLKPKTQPVYLRPKKRNGETNESSNGETENKTSEKGESEAVPQMIRDHESKQNKQTIGENKEVIKSEVKSLRQSAVSMSVGQKEAATKIIEEWLDDGGGDETGTEEEGNDNNEKTEE